MPIRKLSKDKYQEAINKYNTGLTAKEVGEIYCVSESTILRVLRTKKTSRRGKSAFVGAFMKCTVCYKTYPFTMDYFSPRSSLGKHNETILVHICKPCISKKGCLYAKEHREKINQKNTQRLRTDFTFRFRSYASRDIGRALKAQGLKKSLKTMDLIGCTIAELRVHLESKFLHGMSWDNYGIRGWSIDHIKPCASFDLSKHEEQRACFHYTNLQPLWTKDNIKKSSYYNGIKHFHKNTV